jgi:dipeptidyl aminopeptidase/acylaminoacyl peptidase
MALYVNGSRAPSNLYLLDVGTSRLRQLTQNLSPEVDPANLVDAQVVRFPSYDVVAIPSLLYLPLQLGSAKRAPAVLWIHGGPGGQSRVAAHCAASPPSPIAFAVATGTATEVRGLRSCA